MQFSDLELSRRLERAEGFACAEYATARRTLFPDSAAEWIECAGAYAVFDGVDSPITQSFGLGIFPPSTPESLDEIERFFRDRGATAIHEISPFAGIATLDLLCERRYRPVEISTVLYRPVELVKSERDSHITVQIVGPGEGSRWAEISARGWSHEHPELRGFLMQLGVISTARKHAHGFLACVDGKPAAAGVLCVHDGIALFGGSATIPELRNRGLQNALLQERMRHAVENKCDLAMIVTEPGSQSQRNAERKGFRIAYTRTKWQLRP